MIKAIFMIIVIVVLMLTNYTIWTCLLLTYHLIASQTVMPLEIVAWSTKWALVNFLPPPFVILVVVAKLESSLPHDKFASSCISSYSTVCKN